MLEIQEQEIYLRQRGPRVNTEARSLLQRRTQDLCMGTIVARNSKL